MVNQKLLINEEQNEQLQNEGFLVMSFLNKLEVNELTTFFKQNVTIEHGSFYATAHAKDSTFRSEMSDKIVSVIQEKVTANFQNHELLGASFIVKSKGLHQALQPHQDWNIVDESKFRSYNIWIPLVDLNEENGAILVMPKSHSWITNYRHSSISCSFQQVHQQIWENMKPLFLKAGEALIYDHALLHASMPNISQNDRIACACGIIPSAAQMRYYWNNNGTIEEYESSKEFFLTENVFSGPHGLKKIRMIENAFFSVDEKSFYDFAKIKNPNPPEKKIDSNPITSEPKKSFWQVYTLSNCFNEVVFRITKKNKRS